MSKKLSPEQIQLIADSLLPGFLPKNKQESEVVFHFTVEKNSFRVYYEMDSAAGEGVYVFKKYEEVKDIS